MFFSEFLRKIKFEIFIRLRLSSLKLMDFWPGSKIGMREKEARFLIKNVFKKKTKKRTIEENL